MQKFFSMSRHMKRLTLMITDLIVIVFCIWFALAIRLGEVWPQDALSKIWLLFVILPPLGVLLFRWLGIYHNLVRVMGRKSFSSITLGSMFLTVSMLVLSVYPGSFIPDTASMPRSMPFIFFLLIIAGISGVRTAIMWLYEWLKNRGTDKIPTLIYGAGVTGTHLATSLNTSEEYRHVAYIDDDPQLSKSVIDGRKVYGRKHIGEVIKKYQIKNVLLAIPSSSRRDRAKIFSSLEQFDVEVLTVPSLHELASGLATVDQLRVPKVTEILNRNVVDFLDDKAEKEIASNRLLVTGAGGSIGSELARQILMAKPEELVLYENSELALYTIERELQAMNKSNNTDVVLHAVLGSVGDSQRLTGVFEKYQPKIVFHAAAYKHVPIVEANVLEGIRNNVIGTRTVAETSAKMGVKSFVMISTDKAVRPTNVMGASKRLAEIICQDLQDEYPETIFSMVRFGNVLASSGSVIPVFNEQIKNGGPVTVTHPEITRYFMTIPEAAQLVIQASMMANGGDLFVLDMGQPVKVDDMARNMIRLSGLEVKDNDNPDGDIEIIYTGLRPGEKLYEELLIDAKATKTSHQKIMRAHEKHLSGKLLKNILKKLMKAIVENDVTAARQTLSQVVEGYNPDSK